MGWSCSAKAGNTLRAIDRVVGAAVSNGLPNGGFYEASSVEHVDGAITGKCWKPAVGGPPGYVTPMGSFKVNADGTIKRFPGLPKDLIDKAVAMGAADFNRVYGNGAVLATTGWGVGGAA